MTLKVKVRKIDEVVVIDLTGRITCGDPQMLFRETIRRLVDEGWFGPGEPHPRFDERIGDVALVMRGHYTVKDWITGESRSLHIGNHGGTHEDEMSIPLILEEA